MANNSDLKHLAQRLVTSGPHKVEHTPRRVRALLGGKWAVDTCEARYVWEHERFPQFYVPLSSFTTASTLKTLDAVQGTDGRAHFAQLSAGNASTDRVVVLDTPDLPGLVKIDLAAMQQWFEEDVPVYGHPRDPYKRIDILHSTRQVRVELDGVVLAETTSPLFLLETTLRRRTYVPPTCVNWEVLRRSQQLTLCPYKGRAEYYDVCLQGKVYRDLVWYYRYPTAESAPIAGYMCFYDEMVDVWIDGVKQEN